MKLKQFIFALVAMLSFSFSAFAQTTVSSQADLETALQNGGEVTLEGNITVSSPVTIPNGAEVVLNLNGKTLKAANAKTKVLENQGKLTINGQGTVSGIIYNGTADGSTAEMTLNGGTYSLDGNNGGLHHYGKTLTINDGVVVKTTSYGVRMAGKKSVLNLKGGTYTSTGTGDMARPLALSNGTVNFLDSDITVNGHMHVMVGQVTVNFGENNQYSPFEAYHQGNSYASSVFYCKTLAEAISRTGFAAVTLVKNVKVAADAPITVNKEINLNLNGKNLSATNAKTTVLKNYANLTIKGKGTVTGLVYNGDAENKGVAEMTLDGGTYKLDGANGGFFNYGKTLTVNDGVTISSQVYGLRMSNAASVINLYGGTFTSTNPTDNMKRAIAVDAGTINFNDDDITINGYFHANRSKAKVNFGEYCPFDAFMYSTTNASGYYVVNLENAIDKADAGFEIVLQKNLERSEIVTLPKKVTLDGNGKTLTSTAGRAINVDCADVVTIENLTIAGATGCERGINIINKAGTTNLKKVNVSGVSYYAVHVATSAGAAQVNIENSNLTGWAAVAAYGENGTINVKNSNLVGIGNATDNTSNDFATIAAASNITVNVTGGKVTAERVEGKAPQAIVCGNTTPTTGVKFVLDTELELKGTAEYANIDLDKNTVTVREVYGTNYVTTPAGNGLVTLTGASEAMIGNVKYPTIAQAFAAAKEGETITLIADVAPMLVSQRAITKADVIDLNGKTMTLTEDDLYFGTTTFKNGTIVVDPSVKPSTAVFWMFKDQVLTFEDVKLVATGVTGTYLIGLDGDNADLNLFSSEIIVDNETALDLDIICVNASTGNDIWMEDSKVTVKNLDGRVFFRGNYTVAGESVINLEGITKAGFRIEAGQTLTINDKAVVNITGEPRDGGIHLTDPSANYTKAEKATVNATINQPQVAKVGETIYKSLIAAVEAVEDGGTITLVANETFTKTNRTHNSGSWYDGLYYVGDKSFTIDLGGFTISHDGAVNDYLLNFKNSGSKANTITLKNGTIDAGTAAFCAICTSSSQANELTINTENINIINNVSNGSTIKLRGGAVLNVKDGTKITGKNSYLGIECVASTVNIYDGAEIYMNGTTSYNGCLVGACGGGTVNVYGGYGKGAKGGFIAMTSGGTINVAGGEWIANTNGTVGNNSNVYVLTAQSNKNEQGFVGPAIINVTGGTFRGGMDAWVLNNHKDEKAELNISGGNFNADPTKYVEDDYIAVENNGVWNVIRAAAKIGDTKYATLESAFQAATSGCTIDIVSDVTVDYNWDARKTGGKFTVPVTIDGNGKTIKFTASVNDNNYQAAFRFEDEATVKNLTVDMSEVTDNRFRAISSKGNLTVDSCKFIGKDESLNCRAIIFGEGAGANVGNLAISVTNSEFINWKRGITDNENAQDVKTVTITGNTLTDAGVAVSAKEKVTFNGNTVEGAYVNIKSYTAGNKLAVTATGNTLEANTDAAYNVIDAGGVVNAEGFKVVAKGGKIIGYTSTEGIWGEVWGNARNSFVIKVLDANDNVMGTTSLNNVGGIIDGDVTVSWNLKFDAASNTDEYWTMAWTTAPTINNMPAKVQLWVDGVKVSEGDVVLNGPDNLWPIAYAVTDENGVIKSCAQSLKDAIAAGNNVAILKAGTYALEVKDGLTITGAVEGVEFANIGAFGCNGANVTFNNVTFTYASNSTYKGLQHSGNLVYNNCTFNGQVFLYGQSETFNNCTFNTTDAANYNVWTYGAKKVAFNECTFNCAGKSVLIYAESASVTNNVTVTKSQFIASAPVAGKAAIEMDSSLSGAINLTIDSETTATNFAAGNVSGNSLWNNKKGNADDANNDITVKVGDETVLAPVYEAKIGEKNYRNLQDAINAVQNGETVVLVKDFTGNITLTEKVDLHYTIDGDGKQFKGSISVNSLSDTNDNRRITIKNIKFVDDSAANVDFISSVNTNHYPRLTIEGCTFTGSGNDGDVAVRLKSSHSVVIKDCTGQGLHSFLQNTSGWNLTIENVTVTESKGAFALGTVQGVTIKGSTIDVATYGIRLDANTYNNNAVIEGNEVTAFIPVVVRKVNTQSNVTFTGENTFTAENNDGKWMVIGTTEYEEGVALPAEVATGNVVVALNGTNLSYDGVHGAGLAGEGTAEAPYLINNVAELEIFRNSVNAGSAKYSKPGLCVALNADINLDGINWVGIGSMTADHGFMGNFDGKGFKIQNLTINNPALDSDGYAYAGLFALTEGTDKDNQNTIKDLTIENVTINTTGHIVSAAIAYAYYTNVDNVKVCGNIAITGGDYTAGVLAYTRRCVNASDLAIVGNEGSFVKGTKIVGGVISDIQMNGGLTAVYSNFSAEGITVTGEKSVGGIAGIIATQTLNGATVKNVTLNSADEFAGVVAGRLGGTSTISNVVSENVTGATAVIGATYDDAKAVEARIGDTYYATFAAAYAVAQAGETVTMLADLTMSEILVLDKAITLDGNSKTLTSTAGRAINVSGADGVTIKDLTINASGERAINVIQGATNVTIDNVTATAANYTVNLAGSAGAAKVAIKNSNLTGLNVVNVGAAGAEVTVENTTINTVDNNANEGYSSLALNKDAVGGKIIANGVTINITGSACDNSVQATNAADGGVISINGSTDGVAIDVAAVEYGDYYYGFTTIEAAIEHAAADQTVKLVRDVTVDQPVAINKAITLDGNGKTLTYTGSNRAITVENNADADIDVTIKNLTINNTASYTERGINYNENGTLTLENVTVNGEHTTYAINLPGMSQNAKVVITGSKFTGLIALNIWGANTQVTAENSEFYSVDHSTAEGYAAIKLNNNGSTAANGSTVVINGGKVIAKDENGAASIAVEDCTSGSTVTISAQTEVVGSTTKSVAIISYGSQFYAFSTIEEAVEFAKAGDVVTLIRDITTSAQININKNVAIDGNSKKLTVNAARGFQITGGTVAISNLTIDMPNAAEGNRGINLYNGDTNAALDVTLNNVTINGGKAYAVNIGGGKDNKLTINGSTLTGYAAINVHTSSVNHTIVVDGSTLNGKNHNNYYSFGTVVVDGTNAHSLTITNTTITTENLEGVTSKYDKVVVGANCTLNWDGGEAAVRSILADSKGGKLYYTDLQAAINDAAEVSGTVQILGNITATKSIAIPAAKKVTIDLNGKTITGTDNETKSYGLININPGAELTINDATGNGAIKLTATNDRDWNAYSSVISNQRGKLTVNGGIIEHLGGTDMAYAIDNLTNTGAQNAETVINGGTIKSTYRAVRQFLNSTTAQNILTVNGGTIEGTNKSIWMQDANASANPGALTVAADAAIKGDVYLTVTAGSAKWPVTVAVAAAALQGESKVLTTNVPAGYDLANVDGIYGIYSGAAKIGTTYYETVDAAIKAAKTGETVNILAGTYKVPSMKAGITVEGAVNADGTPAVLLEGTLSNTLENLTLKNLHIKGGNAQRWAYAKGDLFFENVIFEATSIYAIHFDNIAAGTNLTYKNCTIIGWAAMGGKPASCVFDGCTIKGNGSYGVIRTYFNAEIKNCTFDVSNVNTNDAYQDGIHAVEGAKVVVDGCTNENGTMKDLVNIHGTSEVTVDGIVYKNVAKVADKNYITIEDAFAAWADGTTLTLLTDIALDTKTLVTDCDGYASIVNVEGKAVTIDLNGKTITVNAFANDLTEAKDKMLLAVFSVDATGSLTINDSSADATGSVVVNADDEAKVYSVVTNYTPGAYTTINGGKFVANKVHDSMIYSGADNAVKVYGGTFLLGNVGTGSNGKPWIFNGLGQNETNIEVYGGTYNDDINHQYWAFEVEIPSTLAVMNNGNGTWTVVEAVASVTEIVSKKYGRVVGYSTIEEAIAALANSTDGIVTIVADEVAIENTIKVAAEQKVVLDLNGKVISGTDNNTSGNFYLINNCGELTITDSSEEAEGKITLKANNERNWNASSVVVANNPGGELTVNGGTIQHLGGTSMAYGIDNLTNGKGTHAVTEIYGGTVESEYIAVRQFLNGVEANNALAVYGGTLDGKYSIFFQDPNAKANSGTLYVDAEAALNASVYLGVNEGSTEWPVEVEVAVAALKNNSTVEAPYVPATYHVTEYPTAWVVECENMVALTINEADYAETGYINLVKKNVETLTYVREFENTGWQSLYLPFGFTITEDMAAEFEFAYIYNASYKGKETVIDFVEVGAGFELAANYPYMIRAKEADVKVIVVENAVLEVTKNETIDCSSVFEKFTFAGNYAANFVPEDSAKKKFFALDGGWSKLTALNPFRFYLQIELRNGSEFPADSDAANSIRMRSVNANGEATTGIDGVDAEQAGDFIFDLQGRRVAEPEKGGIYIINGQKVLVK